jgi:hypothetical protein
MSSSSPVPRFQFSLRWMLISVAVVALLFGLAAFPIGQVVLALLLAILLRGLLPTIALVAAIYGRGDVKAFAIGAAVSAVPALLTPLTATHLLTLLLGLVSQLIGMGICGAVAMATRRTLARRGLGSWK